ncbi:hypothetical protein HK100_005023, partial [Physocladia obscura]
MSETEQPTRSYFSLIWSFVGPLLVGGVFGFALEKAKVYLPSVIVGQFQWNQLSMLITFLTATVTGLVTIAILEKAKIYKRSPKPPTGFGLIIFRGYELNILGGALHGVGMALSGACPGTVLVQAGTGVPTAPFVIAGTLVGAVSYGYFHEAVTKWNKEFGTKKSASTIDNNKPFTLQVIAVAVAAAAYPTLWYTGTLVPWRQKLFDDVRTDFGFTSSVAAEAANLSSNPFENLPDMSTNFYAPAWSPFNAGLGIGIAQLLSILFTDSVIGASGVYPYVGYLIVSTIDRKWESHAPFYASYRKMSGTFFFMIGVVLGAFISSYISGFTFAAGLGHATPTILWNAGVIIRLIFGGIAIVYGSRMAGGCTSGHGIS